MVEDNKGETKHTPLEGIRVVECAIFHAGPGAGAILGDLGAEVIKVESKEGDPMRQWGRVGGFGIDLASGHSFMQEFSNRNKRGITLDITTEKGQEVLHRLVKDCDVFLTNFRKSTKEKLGLTYEVLSKYNPQVIVACVSGYGPEGPDANQGAYDPLGQARSGMMTIQGTENPAVLQLGILDQTTAIAASHEIITALFVRERLGIGQEVHVSLLSTAIWMLSANVMASSFFNVLPAISWDRPVNTPLRNTFCCKDGLWVMSVHHPPQKFWPSFCEATGKKELVDNPLYDTEDKRILRCAELVAIFDDVFVTKNRDEWLEIAREHHLMFSPVQTTIDILNDPQALENNYIKEVTHPDLGTVKIPGYPIHFSKTPPAEWSNAPAIGEHNDEVLHELGYTPEEIEQLRQTGVI